MRSKFKRANPGLRLCNWAALCSIWLLLLAPLLQAAEASSRQVALNKLAQELRGDYPEVSHLGLEELRHASTKVTLIDVRDPKEYAVSRIPGAINISDPEALLTYARNHDTQLVLYCSVGRRSADATTYLKRHGISHASNFVGSIFAWGNAGLALENEHGTTDKVHPYNWFWGWQYLDDELHSSKPQHQ